MNKLYWRWYAIKARCLNERHPDYPRFGGAGITLCEKWQTFKGFVEDMGQEENCQLVRLDKSLGFEKSNCRWRMIKSKESKKRLLPKGVVVRRTGFVSQITIKGKTKYLGHFKTVQEAHNEYLKAKGL